MAYEQFRYQFEKALEPFGKRYGLKPVWYSDVLLVMEPQDGSASAKLCVEFETMYWSIFMGQEQRARDRAISDLVAQLEGYRVKWRGDFAQEIRAPVSTLDDCR